MEMGELPGLDCSPGLAGNAKKVSVNVPSASIFTSLISR
jgi:hypothetical protein